MRFSLTIKNSRKGPMTKERRKNTSLNFFDGEDVLYQTVESKWFCAKVIKKGQEPCSYVVTALSSSPYWWNRMALNYVAIAAPLQAQNAWKYSKLLSTSQRDPTHKQQCRFHKRTIWDSTLSTLMIPYYGCTVMNLIVAITLIITQSLRLGPRLICLSEERCL